MAAGPIKIKEKNKFRDSCVTSDGGRITIRARRSAELRRPPGSYALCLSSEFRACPAGRIPWCFQLGGLGEASVVITLDREYRESRPRMVEFLAFFSFFFV